MCGTDVTGFDRKREGERGEESKREEGELV